MSRLDFYHYHHYKEVNSNGSIFWTVISGVIIFIFSQYFLELILKPYIEYKKVKSEIANKLKYYSKEICNPINLNSTSMIGNANLEQVISRYSLVSDEVRKLSCDLEASFYNNFSFIRKYLIKDKVSEASILLIAISNRLFQIPHTELYNLAVMNSNDIDLVVKYLSLKK